MDEPAERARLDQPAQLADHRIAGIIVDNREETAMGVADRADPVGLGTADRQRLLADDRQAGFQAGADHFEMAGCRGQHDDCVEPAALGVEHHPPVTMGARRRHPIALGGRPVDRRGAAEAAGVDPPRIIHSARRKMGVSDGRIERATNEAQRERGGGRLIHGIGVRSRPPDRAAGSRGG